MANTDKLMEWRHNRQKSLKALPGHLAFLVVVAVVLIALHWIFGIAPWMWLLILAFGVWGLVGDLINIVFLGWRINRDERGRAESGDELGP
jgi:type IV secretory pathway VirB2 component (pilin)